jgi:hypothetical protein
VGKLAQESRPDHRLVETRDRDRDVADGHAGDRDLAQPPVSHRAGSPVREHACERRHLGGRGVEREEVAARVDLGLERASVDLDRDAGELPVGVLEEGRHGRVSPGPLDAVGRGVAERPHQVPDRERDGALDAGEEVVRLGVAVRLEIDERERGLGVGPRLDVLSRARDDLVEEHLRGHVVAEQVLELGHSAHDLERGVALLDHRRDGPARLDEPPRGVRGASGGDPLVLTPAQPRDEASHVTS